MPETSPEPAILKQRVEMAETTSKALCSMKALVQAKDWLHLFHTMCVGSFAWRATPTSRTSSLAMPDAIVQIQGDHGPTPISGIKLLLATQRSHSLQRFC